MMNITTRRTLLHGTTHLCLGETFSLTHGEHLVVRGHAKGVVQLGEALDQRARHGAVVLFHRRPTRSGGARGVR